MKKLLSVLLILCFLMPSVSAKQSYEDASHGFAVKEVIYQKIFDCNSTVFEHKKTGATVLYMETDDLERSFDISFKTPALNSNGTPHVFEHIAISGSEKYPSHKLFFSVMSQTYNTFMNANTQYNNTTYPISSLSEEQLLLLADYYLDGVFNPMIYEEERLFKREAWRYEITDPQEPLTLTGTVYNEMRGDQNIQNAASLNLLDALFPDSILSNLSVGDPDFIPDITYESLLEFHQEYYHPSNSLTVLYGKMDVSPFLEKLDEYFSEFERKDIIVENGKIPAQTIPVSKEYKFPVEKNSQGENSAIIDYGFAANGASMNDSVGLTVLASILNHNASPLKEAVQRKLPGAILEASVNISTPVPYLMLRCQNISASDKDIFKETVDSCLAQMSEQGIDKSVIDAMLTSEQFRTFLMADSLTASLVFTLTLTSIWASTENLNFYNEYSDVIDFLKKESNSDYFENLMKKYLINNKHNALSATVRFPD